MIIPPGSTIGIVGGGQLGRMLAIAAARLGYDCHIFAPEADPPAARVAARATRAPYDDLPALRAFADAVDAPRVGAAWERLGASGSPGRPS